MSEKLSVVFKLENGRVVQEVAETGETLLKVARRANVQIDAPCSGNGTCGKCRMRIESGLALSDSGKAEGGREPRGLRLDEKRELRLDEKRERHTSISEKDYLDGYRLACQCELTCDVTVSVPRSSLAYQNRIRVADFSSARARESFAAMKRALASEKYRTDDVFTGLILELPPPSIQDAMADKERLMISCAKALGTDTGHIEISLHALRKLPQALRENGYKIGVLIRNELRPEEPVYTVFDVTSGEPKQIGVCVDIGTTTVSAALVDLKTREFLATGSAGNAQIRYGADVIGRLVESTRTNGVMRLREAVTKECIQPLIAKLCDTARVSPYQIVRAAISGNTTMIHMFLGVYGNNIRLEPYVPAFFDLPRVRACEIDIGIHPDAEALFAPSVGSYVGGDITAGVFAAGIAGGEGLSLFIDLGTNGELAVGNSEFLMTCACSAGPAFEGGEISCGMRATDGAITAVTIDEATMAPSYEVIGGEGQKPAGICGSGLIDIIGELFKAGIINAKGRFVKDGARIKTDAWGFTRYMVASADDTMTGEDISISDADIDNFIRAKASIFSAIITMLKSLDMDVQMIDAVYLAGGIGSGIDIGHAIGIGMLPNLPEERYNYIGNTSLSGAYAMLVSDKAYTRIREIAGGMTYLELSTVPGYMDEFIAACFLPHTNADLFR